jgi:hypothetical protein
VRARKSKRDETHPWVGCRLSVQTGRRNGNVRKGFLEGLWHGKREDSPYLTSEEGEREISENDGRALQVRKGRVYQTQCSLDERGVPWLL